MATALLCFSPLFRNDPKLFKQPPHLLLELIDILELPVHGCEADVGNLVELGERLHHIHPDGQRCHFLLVRRPLLFQCREETINLFLRHRTLGAAEPDAAFQLATAVGLARAVTLHDNQVAELLPLERGEAVTALGALTPPPNRPTFLRDAGIDNGRVFMLAAGAVHTQAVYSVGCDTGMRRRLIFFKTFAPVTRSTSYFLLIMICFPPALFAHIRTNSSSGAYIIN